MVVAVKNQQTVSERSEKAVNPFQYEYKRLNKDEKKAVKARFLKHYGISDSAFRARLSGETRHSETELVFLKSLVSVYFS